MKQSLKRNYFFVLFSLVSLLLYSCAEEKEFVKNDRNQNFDFKEKSFKEALALPVFNNAYQKVSKWKDAKKNKSASKTALEDEFGFTIVEDAPVRIITDENGTIFYTILIERELKEELKFENLLIKVQNDTTTAAIFKYTLTEKGIATEDNHYPIKDISDISYTDLNLEGKYFYNSNGDFCNEINVIRCSAADDNRPAGHIATQECWDHFNNTGPGGGNYSTIYSSTQITCVNGNIGGGNTAPTNGGNGGTSSNNTGGLGASGGNSNPPPPITAPISCRTGNCIEEPLLTPCQKLNAMFDSSPGKPNLKIHLDALKLILPQDGENGRTLRKNADGFTQVINIMATNTNSIVGPLGVLIYCEIHTHPFQGPNAAFPMFSWTDVYRLLEIYNRTGTFNQADVTLMLVVKDDAGIDQVYSIVINDPIAFAATVNQRLNDQNILLSLKSKCDILDSNLGQVYFTDSNYERAFLEEFRDFNITLYKANAALNNWSKLSLVEPISPTPASNNITSTPCN